MDPRRIATAAPGLCGTVVLAGWVVASLGGLGSASIDHAGPVPVEHPTSSLTASAEPAEPPPAVGLGDVGLSDAVVSDADVAAAAKTVIAAATEVTLPPDQPKPFVEPAPLDSTESETPGTAPVQVATVNPTDSLSSDAMQPASPMELPDECLLPDRCVDGYLWALYQRTPKEDTNTVLDRRKVTVKKKGKMVTVTKTFARLVDADFTWKDPKAAEKARMPLRDYVIGGMDQGFKLKLFHALRAAEAAGLSPGITSAFRDDYRQSIASGLKAASNRSYHGGSIRGGYGHGLAADIVSVKGANRAERWLSSEILWKWVDAHGSEFGIGRPYLGRDPPHVAPIDGKEYASHRGGTKVQHAESERRHTRLVARDDRSTAKRPKTARTSRARTI